MKNLGKGWKKIGTIDVDAGLVWLGDPCYILDGPKPEELGKTWEEFLDKLPFDKAPCFKSFNHDHGGEGLGVCVTTAYGDGSYPVYAKIENRLIKAVMVDFFDVFSEEENG